MKTKCKKGFQYQNGRCVRYVTKIKYSKGGAVKESSRIVQYIIIGLLILLGFLFALNLGNDDVLWSLGFNIFILMVSLLVYNLAWFQEDLPGVPKSIKQNVVAVAWGLFFIFIFYITTKLVPGLSLGVPYLPQAISASFKSFIVNVISPITESIFFLGIVFAFCNKLTGKRKWIALFLSSVAFALFHLGAYLAGLYAYPDFALAYSAFWANFSSFLVAFVFNMIAGAFMIIETKTSKSKVANITFAFVFHAGVNIISWFNLSVIFASIIVLL